MIKRTLFFSLILGLISCGGKVSPKINTESASNGRTIYLGKCDACHGNDGTKGLGGAKDLLASTLTNKEIKDIITTGKGSMAGYGAILSEEEISQVAEYITTLRK
ncbi:cytochrome c [bacterium]|nr:cytochrome c [bacterium]